ncbi:hypothetical protein [Nitratifractor sp.]
MSGYFVKAGKHAILLGCLFAAVQGLQARSTSFDEDTAIVRGLLNEEGGNYTRALPIFLRLYDRTGKTEYLIHAARLGMGVKGAQKRLIARLRSWLRRHPKATPVHQEAVRLLVILYARNGALDRAYRTAKRWLSKSTDPKDLILAATLDVDLKHYKEAVNLLESAYGKTLDEKTLLQIATLEDHYLHNPEAAITLLESHLRMHPQSGPLIYERLIGLYARQKRFDKVLDLYRQMYDRYPSEALKQKIIKLALYQRNFEALTKFLQRHPGNERLLYSLYKEQKRYGKALALAKRLYAQTHQPRWLAEEAILLYEEAKAQKRVTPDVLQKFRALFDRALKEGADDSLYLNYYGYTLIDHGLDIDRGIALVRRALTQQPNNPYYLDSLAWGLYKKGECARAKKVMEKVVAAGEIKEPEIEMHRQKIERCAQHSVK